MKGHENLFSFAVFAGAAFFCAGAYYLHTGLIGALLAMLGIGICAAALFHRAMQQSLLAREERRQVCDEEARGQIQAICDLLRQSREAQESGSICVAEEMTAMRAGVAVMADGMTALRSETSVQLREMAQHQQLTVQKLGELAETMQEVLGVCDLQTRKAEACRQHLAQMAGEQVEKDALLRKLEDIYQRLKKIQSETKRSGEAAEDLQKPLEALGVPLSETLARVMQEIKAQNKAQQSAMEQYKSMTAKDVQMLEQLARVVK